MYACVNIHTCNVSFAGDEFGGSVAIANINGDAYADVIMAAARGDGPSNSLVDAGDIYVLYGKASGWTSTLSASTIGNTNPGFVVHGRAAYDLTGQSISTGRLSGGSIESLVLGVPTNAEANAGKVMALFMVSFCAW
jgi:hypothetical protein